ncbi:DUF4401 domain-containing protein [Arenibacter sp. 6A1]|uniref:DUF4401 domain-containing protein n=1 Tax=Arenibacter sp. 6A1 TaxID=2720391 RepID=UPI001444A9DD|nr:DUF4401 domain-containing protein [Arenibacter sp. 6A1]NKI27608.1 DUF4401 domain-containing protein [Arenibacter sp. 6A1]
MDRLASKKNLIDRIRSSEGSKFECDEDSILENFKRQEENQSSIAIKILSTLGGFIAALAFLGFLLLGEIYDSDFGLLISGIGFIILAIWLNIGFDKLIIETFSASLYILGFSMIATGMVIGGSDKNDIITVLSLIGLSALILTQNYLLSFISVLITTVGLLLLIILNDLYDLIPLYIAVHTLLLTYLFLKEAKIISLGTKISKLYNPVRIGVLVSLLIALISIGIEELVPLPQSHFWLTNIILIPVFMYLVVTIIKINNIKSIKSKISIYTLCTLILVSTIVAPTILVAIIIILLSFLVNYKTGLVIGILSIIYFVSQYYYNMNFTLLTKSILLFTSGIVFLLFYLFTTKKLTTNEKI